MLVIGDDHGPDDLAGVMGGERSGVSEATTDMFLEVAIFDPTRSEEHTSELQSLMRISYAVFCLQKNNKTIPKIQPDITHLLLIDTPNLPRVYVCPYTPKHTPTYLI